MLRFITRPYESLHIRYSVLFFALLLMLFLPYLLPDRIERLVMASAMAFLMISALAAAADTAVRFRVGLVLAVPAAATWFAPDLTVVSLMPASRALSVVFFGYVAFTLLRHVVRARKVDAEILFGAACIYLFFALVWGLLYELVVELQPGSLALGGRPIVAGDAGGGAVMYFSFVTLTTLGYGDITPVNQFARLLAMLEAVLGQLFMVFLVARLVGVHTAQALARAPAEDR
ncbi:MAG: potassium channel family protein [Gemmatimonadales bacterium]|jgi:hypothetical protein